MADKLPQRAVVLPVQVIGELFQVSVRKAGRSPKDARSPILGWRNAFALMETSPAILLAAEDLAVSQFSIGDAIILSQSAWGGGKLLKIQDANGSRNAS